MNSHKLYDGDYTLEWTYVGAHGFKVAQQEPTQKFTKNGTLDKKISISDKPEG